MLIARDAEFAELQSFLNESTQGRGRIVLIEGPAGCGKTELLESVVARAREAGAVVLQATCMPSDTHVPLSTIRQLVCSEAFSPGEVARLCGLLDEAVQTDVPAPGRDVTGRSVRLQAFWSALQGAAQQRLMALMVDDLHHADHCSLAYLLWIAERSRSAKLLMVLTETLHHGRQDTEYRTELLRQNAFRRIRIERLGRRAVGDLLARIRRDTRPGPVEVEKVYQATRGNPLLVRALAEERRTAASEHSVGVDGLDQTTDTFTHAVLTCLHRSGPVATVIAQGLAVLGTSASPSLLSSLCELPVAVVVRGLRALLAAGVIDGCVLERGAVRRRILDELEPDELQALHRQAASLLHETGAPASVIAVHLRTLDRFDEPWGTAVLREAAEQALAEDDDALAVSCLDLAQRWSDDPSLRAEITIRTAVLRRRNNPSEAERTTEELLADLRAGSVPARYAPSVARLFRSQYRLDDAQAALALGPASGSSDGLASEATEASEDGARGAPRPPGPGPGGPGTGGGPAALGSRFRLGPELVAHPVLWPPILLAPGEDTAAAVEALLERSALTDATVEPIVYAIRSLVSLARIDRAQYWNDQFIREAARRGATGWQALFAGLSAEVDLAQGNPAGAERSAEDGLARLGRHVRSVQSYGLIGLEVLAQTAMGKYEPVARRLNEPVLGELQGSLPGLTYLRARGRYSLEMGHLDTAMKDFLVVARSAQRWQIEPSSWLPWRGDLAEVLLRAGNVTEAERLLRTQLAGLNPADARGHGISLRLLAGTVGSNERLPLLTQAVMKLQLPGDQLELAHALCALGRTYQELGNPVSADEAYRQARQLAAASGAQPLQAQIRSEHPATHQEDELDRVPADTRLSDSEKRVAALAACGYTNRDISSQLFITVSTVEQHLTRAYRKLRIEGRQQLPSDLQFDLVAQEGPPGPVRSSPGAA
jgi:DNA-binding CsgD family transcriptional regulator